MTNEEIYYLVCRLHWKSDLSKHQIVAYLQSIGVTSYTHKTYSGEHTHTDLNKAVGIIINSEINSQLKAKYYANQV